MSYRYKINRIFLALFLIIISSIEIYPQNLISGNKSLTINPIDDKYFSDNNGNILMSVNIWGHVKDPGSYIVFDNIDFCTLLSHAGGPLAGANIKEIKLIRDAKDQKGDLIYTINLDEFYKSGDKSSFIPILPNDTIVIKEKSASVIFRSTTILTTILQILKYLFTNS